MLYTERAHMRQVLRTSGDDGGRGQVLLTSTDDCRPVITLGVQLCAKHDARLGVRQRRAVHQL